MKTELRIIFLLSLVLLTLSCSEDDTDQTSILETTVIANGVLPSNEIISKKNIVITNQVEWQELLERLESVDPNILDSFSETNLDFSNVQVIAVFDEVRPHTGFYINVSKVLEVESNVIATVVMDNTENGYTALSQPYQILTFEKINKPVIFK